MCPTLESNQHLRLHAGALPLDQWNIWWTIPDSNRSPQACKASALPDELMAHIATYLCTDGVANHPRILISRSFLNKRPTVARTRPHFRSDNATCYCISRSPVASLLLVGNKGLEPLHLSILEPKSSASANSANSPDMLLAVTGPYLPLWHFKGFTW